MRLAGVQLGVGTDLYLGEIQIAQRGEGMRAPTGYVPVGVMFGRNAAMRGRTRGLLCGNRSCLRRQVLAGVGSSKSQPLQRRPGRAHPRNHAATATIRPPRR